MIARTGRGGAARRRLSAGLLMYRRGAPGLEVFLVHPGGPFFANRDEGAWSVPKGLVDPGETALETARREFAEETGQRVRDCAAAAADGLAPPQDGRADFHDRLLKFVELGAIVQRGGKRVVAWAFEGDWPEGAELESNTFPLEWPRGSGRFQEIPEIDRGEFFDLEGARRKINPAQKPLLERLLERLRG